MDVNEQRPLPGGPLAVDLLNTTWGSGDRAVEWLSTQGAVESFAASWGHQISAKHIDELCVTLLDARRLIRDLFASPETIGPETQSPLLDAVNAQLAPARVIVEPHDGALRTVVTGDHPTNQLAIEALVNAVELRQQAPGRVRSCEHPDCVLWFHDTSKSGRRRWCSMQTCGNRTKAQRHYQRSTQPDH